VQIIHGSLSLAKRDHVREEGPTREVTKRSLGLIDLHAILSISSITSINQRLQSPGITYSRTDVASVLAHCSIQTQYNTSQRGFCSTH